MPLKSTNQKLIASILILKQKHYVKLYAKLSDGTKAEVWDTQWESITLVMVCQIITPH